MYYLDNIDVDWRAALRAVSASSILPREDWLSRILVWHAILSEVSLAPLSTSTKSYYPIVRLTNLITKHWWIHRNFTKPQRS